MKLWQTELINSTQDGLGRKSMIKIFLLLDKREENKRIVVPRESCRFQMFVHSFFVSLVFLQS